MNFAPKPCAAGLWALTWRSVVLLPIVVFTSGFLVTFGLSLAVLPMLGVVELTTGDRLVGFAMLGAWVAEIWAWRRFKLSRYYEGPPSTL